MKILPQIAMGIAVATAAVLIVKLVQQSNTKRMLTQVADEGYETAADLLHPKTNSRFKKLHYGPVLPHHQL